MKAKSARRVAAEEMVEEDAARAARLAAVGQEEVAVAPCLEARIVVRVVPVAGGAERGVEKGGVLHRFGVSSRIGVRSPPPPNQPLVVISMRVFMWTAGTSGLCMCATRLIPLAKKRGSSAAPGIWRAELRGEFAHDGRRR